jgi:hypothetical protein
MRWKVRALQGVKSRAARPRALRIERLEDRQLLAGVPVLVPELGAAAHVDSAPAGHSSGVSDYLPPPITVTPTNPVQTVRVIVLNFEPTVPSMDNRTLWEIFHWNDPRDLAAGFVSDVEAASGGAIDYQIVEWRDLNEFPIFTDGFRYTADEYVYLRSTNAPQWWEEHPGPADFYTIAEQQGLAELVNNNTIDEIWMFGDHFFNLLGEAWMAGPQSFFINGPSFPDFPVDRAVAGFGFNYERGVAEMLHNFGHRTENHGSRMYGGWNIANPVTPWDHFTANKRETNRSTFGVGSVHFPANGASDYDYVNTQTVNSYADDFVMNFPSQTYTAEPITRDAWGDLGTGDWHRGYLRWFFGHLPRGAGSAPDGRQNNWYKYTNDFNSYRPNTGLPRDNEAILGAAPLTEAGAAHYEFTLRYYDIQGIDATTLDGNDVLVTGPGGYSRLAELVESESPLATTAGTARTVRYRITAPGGTWDTADSGTYSVMLRAGEVRDTSGAFLSTANLGTFQVSIASSGKLDIESMLATGQATVEATTWDTGGPAAIFDNSTSSLYRTPNIDPAVITLSFATPQTLTGTRALFSHADGSFAYQWTLEVADSLADLDSQTGTHQLLVPLKATPSDVYSTATFGAAGVRATHLRLTGERLTGDDYIHLNSWELFGPALADSAAPAAALPAAPAPKLGDATASFVVRYSDDVAVDARSINFGDVRVTGPNGYAQTAAFAGLDVNANGATRDATYFVSAPGGTWDAAENGTYVIELVPLQVFDTAGKPVALQTLGTFAVDTSTAAKLDVRAMLAAGAATVTATTWDIGGPPAIFDENVGSVYRTPNIDPAVVTLSFNSPQTLTRFRVYFSGGAFYRWRIEAADSLVDLDNRSGSYQLLVPPTSALSDLFSPATLEEPVSARHVRLTVERLTGDNYVHINAWELLSIPVADTAAPSAMLLTAPGVTPGDTSSSFSVRYSDDVAIDISSINTGDVRVTGPNGFLQTAAFSRLDVNANGATRDATYSVSAPGGTWDPADDGTYSIELLPQQVFDTAGKPVAPLALGTFSVIASEGVKLDIRAMLATSQAAVTATPWDIGNPAAIFDNSTASVYRTRNIDPGVVTLSFTAPQTLTGFRIYFSGGATYRWKVEAADSLADLDGRSGTYQLLVPLTTSQSDRMLSAATAGGPATARYVRLTVERLTGDNYVHINAWELLGIPAADSAVPSAMLLTAPVVTPGNASSSFAVRYSDDVSIDSSSINTGDVRVTGPNGFLQTAVFSRLDVNANGATREATYSISAPGGTWDPADNGTYSIELLPQQVFDTAGKPVAPLALASFDVNVAPAETRPAADLAELNAADWFAAAQSATASTSDDTIRKTHGAASVRFDTTGGFDTYLRYQPDALVLWDLTTADQFHFNVYAQNPNASGFQQEPIIRFTDADGDAMEFRYYRNNAPHSLWNDARGRWLAGSIPIKSSARPATGWRGTAAGTPDWSRMRTVEIHADTWDFGFMLWFDGVGFNLPVSVTGAALQEAESAPRHRVRLDFDVDIGDSLAPGDVTIQNLTTQAVVPADRLAIMPIGELSREIAYTGNAGGILPNGRYRLTLPVGSVVDVVGNSLASAYVFEFEVLDGTSLAGDYNSDLSVDAADYVVWRKTLGSTNDLRADGSGNGIVDEADHAVWQANFGAALVPAGNANTVAVAADVDFVQDSPTSRRAAGPRLLLAEAWEAAMRDDALLAWVAVQKYRPSYITRLDDLLNRAQNLGPVRTADVDSAFESLAVFE